MSPKAVMISIGITLVTFAFFNGVTSEGRDPFMLVQCDETSGGVQKLFQSSLDYSNLYEFNFNLVREGNFIQGVTYDELTDHIYLGTGGEIRKMNWDGSNSEVFHAEGEGVKSLTMGLDTTIAPTRYLYWQTQNNKLKRIPLNKATGEEVVAGLCYSKAVFYKSRLYFQTSYPANSLVSYDPSINLSPGLTCDTGAYENVQRDLSVGSFAFDLADGKLYTAGPYGYPNISLFYRDAGDFNGDTEASFKTDSNDGKIFSQNSDMVSYGDYIYVTFYTDKMGLIRYPKTGSGAEPLQFVLDPFSLPLPLQQCKSLYIHPGTGGDVGEGNRIRVPVKQQKRLFGAFIADLDFNLIGKNAEWTRIEVVFPRRVFNLQIVGCDVRIQRKEQTTGGRVMTTFTIVPESSDDAQGETSFTMIGKIWRKRYGIKAPIVADVYYNYDKATSEDCVEPP